MKASKVVSLLVTLGILGGAGYFGYSYLTSPGKITFLTASVTRGPVESAISATGTLAATLQVNVGSRVSGQVLALHADFNTPVRRGQLLAEIDPAPFQVELETRQAQLRSAQTQILSAEVAERRANFDVANAELNINNQKASVQRAKSQMDEARRKLDQQKSLADQGIASRDSVLSLQATYDQAVLSLESAQAQLKTAEANLESIKAQREVVLSQKVSAEAQVKQAEAAVQNAQLNLDYTKILAPVDGVVISRIVTAGDTVQASMTTPQFFVIAQDLSNMHLDVNIDESDIARLREGLEASFTVDAYPGQTFRGDIIQIRRAAQQVSGVVTYTVVIDVENPDLRLFPGMTANTRIVTERVENALRIPAAALRFRPPEQILDPSAKQKGKGGKDGFKEAPKEVAKGGDDKGAEVAAGLKGGESGQLKGSETKAGEERAAFRDKAGRGGFDRSQFQGFDPSQFRGKGFDPSQFEGRGGRGGGRGGRGVSLDGASPTQVQTVYIKNAQNLVEPVRVRTSISDGTWVVALGNNIQEGMELVTGVEGIATPAQQKGQQGGFPGFPGGGFPGGGGKGRGGFPF
jgi:HlyD family secretion protein